MKKIETSESKGVMCGSAHFSACAVVGAVYEIY